MGLIWHIPQQAQYGVPRDPAHSPGETPDCVGYQGGDGGQRQIADRIDGHRCPAFPQHTEPGRLQFHERTRKIPATAKMNQLKRQPCAHCVTISLNEIQLAIRQAPHIQFFAIHLNTP